MTSQPKRASVPTPTVNGDGKPERLPDSAKAQTTEAITVKTGTAETGTAGLAAPGPVAPAGSEGGAVAREAWLEPPFNQREISDRELLAMTSLRPIDVSSMKEILKMERLCHVDQWSQENFTAELLRPFTLAKGLWLGQSLVGMSLSWIVPPECHLLNLMIHPKLWGRGLGRYLMLDLIESAKAKQAYKILLEVKVGNQRAERLYERLGFTGSGLRRAYYSDGSNAILMSLELPAPPGARLTATKRQPPRPPSRG